jgi:hypothetical protein
MKKLWLAICVWAALAPFFLYGDDPNIPMYPLSGTIAPYVDKDGYINPLISLGDITPWDSMTLPLVLNYSSAVRPPSPEFGQGWECPLFDAKIYDVQQNLKRVEMLGGKELYLIYNPRNDTWKHYFADDWTGEAKGDEFTLTSSTSVKLTFRNGLISSMTTPNGRIIDWTRSGDKVVSLGEEGKAPAMQVLYDKLGFATKILLKPDAAGDAKQSYSFNTSLISAGIDKITCPNGREITFERSRDKLLNPVVKWTDSMHLPITLTWDFKTGKIISDDKFNYQVTELNKDGAWPKMTRVDKATKKVETYYFDQLHGTTDQTFVDGTQRHIEMIQAPGPNYKAIRLIEETKNGKTRVVLRRSFDEKGHLIQEAFGLASGREQVKQFVYDVVGRPVSYLLNGKEMWKNIYDPVTGLLKERDLPNLGMKLSFDQLPGGDVKESVEKAGGSVVSNKTLAPAAWQATLTSAQRLD